MSTPRDMDIVGAVGRRLHSLIRSLLRGNARRARVLAGRVRDDTRIVGERIAVQNLIEDLAQGQAVRNAFISLPSAVPGIGTLLSWALISVEDFFIMDQCITLILALGHVHGLDPEDEAVMEELALLVIGEAYGLALPGTPLRSEGVIKGMVTQILPRKYVNSGSSRWVKALIRRALPFRRKSRLLPVGLGIVISAWYAYETVVKVGSITLRELSSGHLQDVAG